MVRVGLIGTGWGTRTQMPAFRLAGADVVAICSGRRDRAEAAAKEWGVPVATDDYRELVERDDVDVVSVCTPPAVHAEMSIAALNAGKHLICEKPLAPTLAEASEIAEAGRVAAERRPGLVRVVHHEMRYIPIRRHLSDLVSQGFIGEPRAVVGSVLVPLGTDPTKEPYWYTWIADRAKGGGFMTGLMSHHLDLLRFTVGDLHDVTGHTSILMNERPQLAWEYRDGDEIGPDSPTVGMREVDADDTAVATGRLDNRAPFVLSGTWSIHHGSGVRLELYGSEGSLVLDGPTLLGARAGDALAPQEPPACYGLPEGTGMVPLCAQMMQEVADVVDGRCEQSATILPTLDDGLAVQEIIENIGAAPVRVSERTT